MMQVKQYHFSYHINEVTILQEILKLKIDYIFLMENATFALPLMLIILNDFSLLGFTSCKYLQH